MPSSEKRRIDSPHSMGKKPLSLDAEPENQPELVVPTVGSMKAQAGELAGMLQCRQQEIDRREALLNAQVAQVERERRACRLWLQEHRHVLEEESESLGTKSRQLVVAEQTLTQQWEQRQKELDQTELAFVRREAELNDLARQLELRDHHLQEATQQLGKQRRDLVWEQQQLAAEKLAAREHFSRLMKNNERRRAGLELREQQLEARSTAAVKPAPQLPQAKEFDQAVARQHAELKEKLASLEAGRAQLREDRSRLAREIEERRKTLETEEGRRQAQQKRQAKELALQREHVEQKQQAMEKMQTEVTRMHREALEMRLIAEQLWSQLAGSHAPAELTHSLARLRKRLADHYRLASEGVSQQREELGQLTLRLEDQQKSLHCQKKELQDWLGRRNQEIEEQAARLVAREQELDRRERMLEERQHDWRQCEAFV